MNTIFLDADGFDIGKYTKDGSVELTATVQELWNLEWKNLELEGEELVHKESTLVEDLTGKVVKGINRINGGKVEQNEWFYVITDEISRKSIVKGIENSIHWVTYRVVPVTRVYVNGYNNPEEKYDEINHEFVG